jgi:hypothetical protein
MIDPITIASASAALVGYCGKVSEYINTFVNKVHNVDTSVRVLGIEIDSLSRVFGLISVKFSEPSVDAATLELGTGPKGEPYWNDVMRSMDDCKIALASLERILYTIKRRAALHGV